MGQLYYFTIIFLASLLLTNTQSIKAQSFIEQEKKITELADEYFKAKLRDKKLSRNGTVLILGLSSSEKPTVIK